MEVRADYKQIVGEVKERNKFYRAIIEIRGLVEGPNQSTSEDDLFYQEILCKIKDICDLATKGIL